MMMKTVKEIARGLWSRIAQAQYRIQKLMVKKANALGLCLLSIDMMVILRENEKIVIANILPQGPQTPGQFADFALLYLDLPKAGITSSYFKLQLRQDPTAPQAQLLNADNQPVGKARYLTIDIFAAIVDAKTEPAQKLPIFETFNKTNDTYVIGGTHADGQAFVIVLDL
jgi:hypothetical protein